MIPIIERRRLNALSEKETYHLVLDISKTNLSYRVGDCVAIYPQNDPILVQDILDAMGATGKESVIDKKGNALNLRSYLSEKANLVRSPKKLGGGDHVLASLQQNCGISPQALVDLLSPLLPRFYSIASSMEAVGKEIHLTVSVNENPKHFPTRYGTCSHFLCKRAPLNEPILNFYLHPAKSFYLSPESFQKPIIMVGPGTGIAPFRGFLQERLLKQAHNNWLFFGERNQKKDYYYEEEWKAAVQKGALRLDTAFSRDTSQKIYVQDRLLENSHDIWKWLEDGAYFYVCGDAKQMAKSVDQALHTIVESEGKEDPKEYIKNLKRQNRYVRDVY
ncbi:MAG: sulfite reductase [Chlamydiales bacterium]|nr:sulfite reductase [Chlamydiales bacterium]